MPNYFGQDLTLPAPNALNIETMSAVQRGKSSMLTDSAEGSFLSAVGQNYGVPRPEITVNDDLYRQLIQLLAWQPKTILFTLYKLLGIVFGSQASIIIAGDRPWRVYEVNANEIIIELPTSLIAQNNETASYLHGWYGQAQVPAGPTATFTTLGDVTTASATTLVGKNIYAYYSGVWNAYTVSSASYSVITGLSTVVVSAATLPTGGCLFYIDIPGDEVSSFRGDFLAASAFFSTFTTTAGPPTNTIQVIGDATISVNPDHVLTLVYGGTLNLFTVLTVAYSPTTNLSTIVMTTSTIPGGLTGETVFKALDVSDTTTTPDHDDRVYLSALGAYEIVAYYLDLLVRAAGIVIRLEQV
jgi:hypothetical protein